MKRLVICVVAACVVPSRGTMPPGQPSQPGQPAPDHRGADAVQTIAGTYDRVLDGLADAAALGRSARWEEASKRYREADSTARQMLNWFASPQNTLGRGATVRYPTRHDGMLDEASLTTNLRNASTLAQQGIADAFDHSVEQLANELGATSPGQRAALRQHGRPDAIEKRKKDTCWIFHGTDTDETFCWGKGGLLAHHDKAPKATPAVAWQPAPPAPAPSAPAEPAPFTNRSDAHSAPAPSEPARGPATTSIGGGGNGARIAWWKNAGDCKAMVNKNDFYCTSGDCKALVNKNDFYCESGDCKAIVNNNDFYCTSGDCKALVNKNDFYCETGDCKALVNKNDFYCESQGCKAVVNNNDFYCE